MATSPAAIFLAGPPVALDTLAGVVLNKVGFVGIVGACLMAIFEVVRHTRTDEEEGRTELVRGGVVGRDAAPAAAMLVTTGACLVLALALAAATAAAQVSWSDALLFGLSVGGLGVVTAATALVAAQVVSHGRTATGIALALFGVGYAVRGIGDVNSNALVWFSPVGWAQATHPVGDPRWWPLLLPVVASILLVMLALRLGSLRDVGAGLVAERRGPAAASARLSNAFGLAMRIQRGMLISWVVGIAALGLTYGSLTQSVKDLARNNPTLEKFFEAAGQGSLVDSFLSTMLLVLALLTGAYATASASRLSSEEAAGHLEPLLATGLSRTSWMLGSLGATVLGSAAVLVAGGLGLGASYGLSAGDPGQALKLAGQQLVYLPAVLLLAALAALLHGWRPGWGKVVWVVLAVWFVLDYLGGLLNVPDWLVKSSPFAHIPEVPAADLTWAAPTVIAALCLLLVAVGVTGFRRRDIA
jgi:ABC-2 type transport system permease protein